MISNESNHDDSIAIAWQLNTYTSGINAGDYRGALATRSARFLEPLDYDSFAEEHSTTQIFGFRLESIEEHGPDIREARVHFTSEQAAEYAPDGKSNCTRWSSSRIFIWEDNNWKLDDTENTTWVPC